MASYTSHHSIVLLIIALLTHFVQSVPSPDDHFYRVGETFTIINLILVVPHYIFFKQNMHVFDFFQLSYFFSLMYPFSYGPMESTRHSWIMGFPSFFAYEHKHQGMTYLNFVGPILTFSLCLLPVITLAIVGTLILRRTHGVTWRLLSVYGFFKGFIRWVFIGLVCFSTMFIYLGPKYDKGEFSLAIIVLIICSAYPILQLVIRILQERSNETLDPIDPAQKYLQYISFMRLFFVVFFPNLIEMGTTVTILVSVFICSYPLPALFFKQFRNKLEVALFVLIELCIAANWIVIRVGIKDYSMHDGVVYTVRSIITLAFVVGLVDEVLKYLHLYKEYKNRNRIFGSAHDVSMESEPNTFLRNDALRNLM